MKRNVFARTLWIFSLIVPGMALASAGDSPLNKVVHPAADCTEANCPGGAYYINTTAELESINAILKKKGQDQQVIAQWTNDHYALLIAPGVYTLPVSDDDTHGAVTLGYYTQILGLGKDRDDVKISPGIEVYNQCPPAVPGVPSTDPNSQDRICVTTGGLNNFWRGVENLNMVITGAQAKSGLRFAVSQAAPLRHTHISGKLVLCDWYNANHPKLSGPCGYTSGGFMADVQIDNGLTPGSQQQWLTRHSTIGSSETGTWNTIFVGTKFGAQPVPPVTPDGHQPAPGNTWVKFPLTNLQYTPTSIREKPYLVCENCSDTSPLATIEWKIAVPALRLKGSPLGVDNSPATLLDVTDETSLVINSHSGITVLDASQIKGINEQLSAGKNIIFMPGVYSLEDTIIVPSTAKNTIILGVGLPTLVCSKGVSCMSIQAEQGVELAGVVFEAGYINTPTLLEVGTEKNSNDNSANPNFLYDVYARIAETQLSSRTKTIRQTTTAVVINTNNVVGDNLWIWRGDHDKASGTDPNPAKNLVTWEQNVAQHGLIVNGDEVAIYGLAVEHFRDYQTLWYGDKGQVYFYQSEMPYDVPKLEDWTCTEANSTLSVENSCASYVIGKEVKSHTAWGVGVYSYFAKAKIQATSAIKAPNVAGISLHHVIGRWLNGQEGSGVLNLITNTDSSMCWGLQATCNLLADGVCQDVINQQTPVLGHFPAKSTQTCTPREP